MKEIIKKSEIPLYLILYLNLLLSLTGVVRGREDRRNCYGRGFWVPLPVALGLPA